MVAVGKAEELGRAVLSAADLVTVVLILLSGLARGVWSSSFAWKCFDAFVHLPVGGASTTVSIATLVAVTVERVAIIRTPFLSRTLCTASVAHKTCLLVLLGSVVFNVPYCFTFTVAPGHLAYSDFASSRYYTVHNWVRLVVLGLVPAVTLLLGNLLLLHALWCPRRDSLPPRPLVSCTDQRRLSWVLVGMICSFLVGEFPTHVASRASATSLLFPGQPQYLYTQGFRSELQIGSSTQVSGGAVTLSGVGFRSGVQIRASDQGCRIFKLVVITLMSIHYSCNFSLCTQQALPRSWPARISLTSAGRCVSWATPPVSRVTPLQRDSREPPPSPPPSLGVGTTAVNITYTTATTSFAHYHLQDDDRKPSPQPPSSEITTTTTTNITTTPSTPKTQQSQILASPTTTTNLRTTTNKPLIADMHEL
ncbi:putative G-protein coupled receptor-like [Homarus americanus]|uniref:Putative G-protein coupled receptor-like n=1 Tax=Homarus americanus TaxID=6706 RepID=A0A8J5N6U2_HOMAM|nr:putative G-protein coupled receptor-like [Homarus americanus]